MPARPLYFHRLEGAIGALEGLPTEWIDRRTLEELLGVSKTVAWRILRRCGAEEGPGNTLICRRGLLIDALRRVQSTGEFEREVRRRDRLSVYLERLAEIGRSRKTKVASEAKALEIVNARFDRLPAGITLSANSLLVEFHSPEQFLERIGVLIYTLQNDYDAVRAFLESGIR